MESVVRLTRHGPAIGIIAMEDRAGRNTFTEALVAGLGTVFAEIAADPELKVIVIHGYDTIFCAGGTLEELLTLADHKVTFDAHDFFRALLDCPLPVIAAMQGHALGGGLVFGLYADMVVLSRESLYSANFMKYGITPGMGATLLLPHRLGSALANEMLFSARGYHGGALAERGVSYPVVPRGETIAAALHLAQDLADKPAFALRRLKATLNAKLIAELPEATAREKAMHEEAFSQPDIVERITSRFGR